MSTGIAPWSWPVGDIPTAVWQHQPAVDCALRQVAGDYYGCNLNAVLSVPGSQFAIQTLPQLFPKAARVALPQSACFEHLQSWQRAGHRLFDYNDGSLAQLENKIAAGELDVVLAVNPSNSTTTLLGRDRLLHWCELLARRGGCLIIDEAFMDSDPGMSLVTECPRPGLVVLRSIDNFFGLVGLQLAFVLADTPVLGLLHKRLASWVVNGPAQYLGRQALIDTTWHEEQRQRINHTVGEQIILLETINWANRFSVLRGPLYCSVAMSLEAVERCYNRCGKQGILLRRFERSDCEGLLRFDLTKDAVQLERLTKALTFSAEQGRGLS